MRRFPLSAHWATPIDVYKRQVLPELRPEDADESLLRFACYAAVCHTVYGASYDSLTTQHILGLVLSLIHI